MITTTETTTTETTENIKINTFCDTCDNTDYATEKALESAGWELSPNYQFCPNCAIG
jgi:hypothetical protein